MTEIRNKNEDAPLGSMLECYECGTPFKKRIKTHIFCSTLCRQTERGRSRWKTHKEELSLRHKKWSTENFSKRRNYMINYTYGITPNQYDEMLESQNHSCFICKRHENEFKSKLAIDHDHVTGEIRGLLCSICNKMVIGKNRDPEIFKRAYEYLSRPFTGWFVPAKKKKRKKSVKTSVRIRK